MTPAPPALLRPSFQPSRTGRLMPFRASSAMLGSSEGAGAVGVSVGPPGPPPSSPPEVPPLLFQPLSPPLLPSGAGADVVAVGPGLAPPRSSDPPSSSPSSATPPAMAAATTAATTTAAAIFGPRPRAGVPVSPGV
ncbi:hypothetical protein SAZ11_12870 [Streptomyces sp. FXJ1.4098]|nr:hypothetical protein [Streptomyces sp. FXJ1.4098]